MFDRNEWLKWAESAKNNNPSMREFRRSYRNIQEESNPVDEVDEDVTESLKDILAGAKNILHPKGSRFFYMKEPGKTIKSIPKSIKKPFKAGKDFVSKAVKDPGGAERTLVKDAAKTVGSGAAQAYLWSKIGQPSKKEREEMERQSSTRLGTQQPQEESVELDEIRRARPKTKQIDATLLTKMKKVQTQTKDKSGTMQGLMTPEQKGMQPGKLSDSVEYRLAELGYQLDEAFPLLAAIPALLGSLGTGAAAAGGAIATGAGAAASAAGGALASGAGLAARGAIGAGKLAMRAGGGIKKGLVGSKSIIGKNMAKKKSFIGPPKPKAGMKKFIPGKESLKSAGKTVGTQGAMMAPMMMMGRGGGKPNTTVQTSAPPPPPATGAGSESNARQRARQQLAASYEPEGTELNEFIGGLLKGLARRKAPLPKALPKALPKGTAGAVKTPTNAPNARKFVQKQKQGRIELDKMKTSNAPYATGSAAHTQAKTALQPKLANLKTQLQQKRSQGVIAGKQGSLGLSPSSGAKPIGAYAPPKLKVLPPPPKLTRGQKIKQGAKKAFAPGTKDTQAGIGRRAAGTVGSGLATAGAFGLMTPKQKADTTVQSTRQLAASVGRIASKYAQQLDESRMSEIHAMSQEGKTHEEIGKEMDIHPSVIKKVLQGASSCRKKNQTTSKSHATN
jgi:hypothetical protein